MVDARPSRSLAGICTGGLSPEAHRSRVDAILRAHGFEG